MPTTLFRGVRNWLLPLTFVLCSINVHSVVGQNPGLRAAKNPLDQAENLLKQTGPSIASLYFYSKPPESEQVVFSASGTGFLLADATGQKWIISTAHSLVSQSPATAKGKPSQIVAVECRFNNSSQTFFCLEAIVNETEDLIALKPSGINLQDLPVLKLAEALPPRPARLYAIGSASALKADVYSGALGSDTPTIAEIAQSQRRQERDYAPLHPKLRLIRHQIPIAAGYSGCPILSEDARVVGVQSSTLPDAAFVGFAVHFDHLTRFPWKKPSTPLKSLDLKQNDASKYFRQTAAQRVPYRAQTETRVLDFNATLDLGGVAVKAPFLHHGYVTGDAKEIVERYVQDKEWYLVEKYGGQRLRRLQQLLDRTQLARITNPVLGMDFLVPKDYQIGATPTTNPKGLLITLTPPEGRSASPPYDAPLSIWVTFEPKLCREAESKVDRDFDAGKYPENELEKRNPAKRAEFRDRLKRATIADVIIPRFVEHDLELTVIDGGQPVPRATKDNPQFRQYADGEGAWLRSSYLPEPVETDVAHSVRVASNSPLVAVVHFQYSVKQQVEFSQTDGVPDPTHCDFSIIAGSVSLR